MKTFLILFAILRLSAPLQAPSGKADIDSTKTTSAHCVEYGIDYQDYNIDILSNIGHWTDCAKLCNDHRSCSFWTWHTDDKHCWLKSSDAKPERQANCLSGSYQCLSEC